MLLALQMPTWLVDFWTVYGSMITPVLVTLLTAIVTSLALKIKSDAKANAVKADLQIEALKNVANREDNKPQLEEQSQKISELEQTIANLADMFTLAFQNSNLSPEIKNNLAALANKIKYGTEEDLVKELEAQKAQLEEQVAALTEQLKEKVVAVAEDKTPKRTRR